MTPSLQSKILARTLKTINFKKIVEKKARKKLPRTKRGFVPKGIRRFYLVNIQTFNDKAIATFERNDRVSKNHIVFFHGGAYLFEASPNHWMLSKKIVNTCFCRMTLIDYPLAPEYIYRETFEMVSGAYELLLNQYPEDNFIFMGDSAGGGLALAFTQKLIKEKHARLPAKNILLSPWLDMTMSNPDIKSLERSDYILSVEMLRIAGLKYSNGEDLDQYLLSPINGEFKDIPRTIVFYSTEELFYSDCMRLRSMPDFETESIVFREYEKMPHDWAIFPIPESDLVVHEICTFIS